METAGHGIHQKIFSKRVLTVCMVFIVLATVGIKYAESVKDGDVWFHLAYGRYLLDHGALIPDHTIFSWTPADGYNIYCAWIPEIVLYVLHSFGGLTALFAMRYVCFFIFALFVFLFSRSRGITPDPLTWLVCLTGVLMAQSAAFVKPEIFSFVLMTAFAWLWFTLKSGNPGQKVVYCYYLIPLLFLIWMNTHGGVVFGMTFLGLIFLGEVLNQITRSPHRLHHRARRHFFAACVLSLPALLATPYGWKYPAILVQSLLFGQGGFSKDIGSVMAYQSVFFPDARHLHLIDYGVAGLLILAILLFSQIRSRSFDWTVVIPNIFFCLLYAWFLRTTYFWAAIFTFSSLHLLGSTGLPFRDRLHLRSANVLFILVLVFFSARACLEEVCSPKFGFGPSYISPVEEADFIRTNCKGLRLGNDYDCGAYLLWALWPDTKVFIDARYFPYSRWYREYDEFMYTKDQTVRERFLKKYPADVWCLTYGFPQLSFFLNSPDWRLVYYGPSACIFLSSKVPFSAPRRAVSDSIYRVNLFQADVIAHFAIAAGDLPVAENLVRGMKPLFFCRIQKDIAANASVASGNAFLRSGRVHESIESFTRALSFSPGQAPLHNSLGNALLMSNRIDDAISQYASALNLRPDYVEAQKNLDMARSRKIKIDESIAALMVKLGKNPADPKTLHSLGVLHAMKADYDSAQKYFLNEREITPDNPEVHYNLACLYAKLNNTTEAVKSLEAAILKGFHDTDLLKKDPDLANIRNTPYYKSLVPDR